MKYYYAIVTCNSKQTAIYLYDEYNGFEFENTNLKLHMSFVPDDMVFSQKVKEEATKVPMNYEFSFLQNTYNRALGHSKVKLTWDQADPVRAKKLQQGFKNLDPNDSEAEREFYKDFIASGSSDNQSEKSEQDIEEYRKKLLSGLDDNKKKQDNKSNLNIDNIDWDKVNPEDFDSDDLDAIEEGKTINKNTPDIQFTTGFGENIGKKLLTSKKEKAQEAQMSAFEKY